MKNINNVMLKGKIVYKYITPKNSHVLLTIDTYNGNHPKVFFPRQGALTVADAFEIGDEVVILGNFQSSKKENGYSCCIFGNAIGLSENSLNRKNYFELSGRIIKYTKDENIVKMIIASNTKFYSTVPVVFYRTQEENMCERYKEGDMISVRGVIQTKKTVGLSGKVNHYENYVGIVCR